MRKIGLLLFLALPIYPHRGGQDKCGGHGGSKLYHVHNQEKARACEEAKSKSVRNARTGDCDPYDPDDYSYSQSLEKELFRRFNNCSPYDGQCFESLKDADIEHIVSRSEAHYSGLCRADKATRKQFASDPDNLTIASPELNRSQKKAKDAAEWQPQHNKCWFAQTVIKVKKKYGLTIDTAEQQALQQMLTTCQ